VQLIVGVELSVRDSSGVEDHLLGYFIDPEAASLQEYLGKLQADRLAMAEQTLGLLESLGVPVSRARVAELAQGAVVTRPHIARALVEAGHVATEHEAFARFLGSGRPAAPRRPSPEPATAIAAMRAAGGSTALAHPCSARIPTPRHDWLSLHLGSTHWSRAACRPWSALTPMQRPKSASSSVPWRMRAG